MLLFGLGFLTAVLAVLLVAPAVHGRIVRFAENRLRATLPFSPQEVRAQKDMVRAEMAMRLAKTGQDLTEERHKAAAYQIQNDAITEQAGQLYGENADLKNRMVDIEVEAGGLRSAIRESELVQDQLRLTLAEALREDRLKEERITQLNHKIRMTLSDLDNLKIDLATRDTEMESLKARINALRDDRDALRNDLKLSLQRAKDAELRLAREENRAQRFEDKLQREMSIGADRESIIERRVNEIARLKDRLKAANADSRETARLLKQAGIKRPPSLRAAQPITEEPDESDEKEEIKALAPPVSEPPAEEPQAPVMDDDMAIRLSDDVRNQTTAVTEELINAANGSQDDKLRVEIADIAAKMIAVTAHREGPNSPILPMLTGKSASSSGNRTSLAERANRYLRQGRKG